ncbi:MAG TPA: SRPBCC family protein, partial [Thermomonas sp.]|nr:SRPBCC family protein [Thermomonas sp.]
MPVILRSALVEHSAARMFALVNDVAAYSRRFDWCREAQVLEERLATALALCPQKAGLLLLVLGSKGGVGASVVAANLALALQHA